MKLGTYLKDAGLDDAAFAERSEGAFSAEAVRKWRFGVRMPRPNHLALISRLTDGQVTANDFMEAAVDRSTRQAEEDPPKDPDPAPKGEELAQ